MPTTFADIREATTPVYTATIKDELGVVIPAASLSTLTLTYYEKRANTIINSRDGQNILNANNVTVSSGGVLTWTLQPADTAILDVQNVYEEHIALFAWTWAAGAKAGKHEVRFIVTNMTRVP